jgi:hypothetical protein
VPVDVIRGFSGPRLCAKHQSLRANIVTIAEGLSSGHSLRLTMLRLVLGGHSRAPATQRSALQAFEQHALEMRLAVLPHSQKAFQNQILR